MESILRGGVRTGVRRSPDDAVHNNAGGIGRSTGGVSRGGTGDSGGPGGGGKTRVLIQVLHLFGAVVGGVEELRIFHGGFRAGGGAGAVTTLIPGGGSTTGVVGGKIDGVTLGHHLATMLLGRSTSQRLNENEYEINPHQYT